MIPDPAREAQILRDMREAATHVVAAVAVEAEAHTDPVPDEVAALSAFAGHELEAFAAGMLRSLIDAADGARDVASAAWVERHFHACLGEVGMALREAIGVSTMRHAVAQTLQRKVFEAEINLVGALGTPKRLPNGNAVEQAR